jgi:hypothetical protein
MIKEEFLFASGLDFNHLYVLQNINNLPEVNRLTGYYNILKAKGYIDGEVLSDKGQEIISLFMQKEENCIKNEMLNNIHKNEDIVDNKQNSENVSEIHKPLTFSQWIVQLHEKLQKKVWELYDSNQTYIVVQGTRYPYLCGIKDLEGKIKKFIGKYDYKDLERIEKLLLKHCEVKNQKIVRYILKEGAEKGSDMASDYENYVEETPKEIIKKESYF